MECMKAHDLCELRVLAAIQMGILDMSFKTKMCAAYVASEECQQGTTTTYYLLSRIPQMASPSCWSSVCPADTHPLCCRQVNFAIVLMGASSCELRQQCCSAVWLLTIRLLCAICGALRSAVAMGACARQRMASLT